MSKPTDKELKIALDAAAQIKEHNADHHYLAKALLNHHYRIHYLKTD